MEAKIVQFAVRDNNNLFKLELYRTLLHFTEFDFTYFWERCIDAGRTAKKTGRLPQNTVANAKNVISGVHPYVEALINSDFSEIVTDCIIEYICHSERIGFEELWVRCISPKNLYEEAIFSRISQYKVGKAVNQWENIVRLQEYARNKLAFIYDCDGENSPQEEAVLRTRKEYFDLAYSMAANELGIDGEKLPSVRVSSPSLAPNATFMNAKVSKAIYRRFAEALRLGGDMSVPASKNCGLIKDRLAMDAYAYVRGMKRPAEIDMRFALEAFSGEAEEIYLPDSFKAVIDLEFDLIMKNGIVLRRCEDCGRYFAAYDDSFLCNRVNSSGMTCRQQFETLKAAIAEAAEAERESHEAAAEEDRDKKQDAVPPELEKRGQKIYNALYKRVGKAMDEKEFREWSRYLSDMKRNIKTGEATTDQLAEFLDYSDRLCEEVKSAVKSKSPKKPEFRYPEEPSEHTDQPTQQEQPERIVFADEDPEMAHIHVPVEDDSVPLPEIIKAASGAEVEVKPFRPETFDSAADAFIAGAFAAAEDRPKKKPVEIKTPQWTRLTREEAYGRREDGE
ncbi:MAG: hypothetical protein ACI4J6_11820 [Oscillospiraceae bacterium]